MIGLLKYFDYSSNTLTRAKRMKRAANKAKFLGLAMRNNLQLRVNPEKPSSQTLKTSTIKDTY